MQSKSLLHKKHNIKLCSNAGSAINEGFSGVSDSVAEYSPLGKPTASTVGAFSERIKQKTSDPSIALVSAEGGVTGGKPGKGSKANNQGIPALTGSDSKSSEAPPADGVLLNTLFIYIFSFLYFLNIYMRAYVD